MTRTDEIIIFFADRKRDCKLCPIREECNNCDAEISCDEMAERVLDEQTS